MAIYHAFYFAAPPPGTELRLVTRNRVSLARPLPQYYGQKIRAIPGVREVEIEQWFGGKYIDDRPEHMFARMAIEPDKFFIIYPEVKIRDEQKQASTASSETRRSRLRPRPKAPSDLAFWPFWATSS